MTRDEIIRMAQEIWGASNWSDAQAGRLERFAALAAAAERDRMCEQFNIPKELAYEKSKSNETD